MADDIQRPCENCGSLDFVCVTSSQIKTVLTSALVHGGHQTTIPDVAALVDVYVCEDCNMLRFFLSRAPDSN